MAVLLFSGSPDFWFHPHFPGLALVCSITFSLLHLRKVQLSHLWPLNSLSKLSPLLSTFEDQGIESS